MSSFKDLTGIRFGNLVALKLIRTTPTIWECQCDCGRVKNILSGNLSGGYSKTCGCAQIKSAKSRAIHNHAGYTNSRTYQSWGNMISRCSNPNNKSWPHYGGRGISVCKKWRIFKNFLRDLGECPPGMVLDRKNNNDGYSKSNCKWSTRTESSTNRRITVFVVVDGVRMSGAEAARRLMVNYRTLMFRIKKLGPEKAVEKSMNPK